MAQNFTSFTPVEEAEPQTPTAFTSFTPIEEVAQPPVQFSSFTPIEKPFQSGTAAEGMVGYVPRLKPTPTQADTRSTVASAVVDDFDAKLAAQEAKQKEFSFGEELGKGVKGAIKYTLPSMAEQLKLQGSSDAFLASQKRLELLNKIDSGAYKNLNEIQSDPIYQALKNDGQNLAQVNGYFANRKSPEIAAKLRSSVQKDFDSMATSAGTSIDILNKYARENKKKYGARVEKFTDINWTDPQVVADFTNWLGYNMGSAGVQLAPIMVAGLVAKSPGVLTLSSAMETASSVQNRMEFIKNKTKNLPPDQQAAAISKYVAETGDTNLMLGLISGSFDLVLGPTASIVKTNAKRLLEQMSKKGAAKAAVKQLPKDILQEGVTGTLQESTQIAGKKSLGEEGKRITGQNIKDVINAAAAEAAGAPVGTAINVARDVYAAPGAPKEEAGQTITEPTLDTAAPLAPTPAAGEKEPTLDDAALPTGASVSEEKPPRPFDDAERAKTEQIVKRLLDSGYPMDSAQRIAIKQVNEERKKVVSELVTEPTEDEIQQRAKELIDKGVPPEEALNLAPVQIMEERKADALAQAETQGEQNDGQTISDTGGTSVPVAEQPNPNAPTAGVEIVEPSGVVPAGQDVAGVAGGKAAQPVAVTPALTGEPLLEKFRALNAQGKITSEDMAQISSWVDADVKPTGQQSFDARLAKLIEEVESRPTEGQAAPAETPPAQPVAVKPTDEERIAKEDRQQEAYEAKKAKAQNIARSSASTAFDQVGEYANLDEALDSYRENMADTLVEEGFRNDPDYGNLLNAANRAFEDEVNKQKTPAAEPAAEPIAEEAKTDDVIAEEAEISDEVADAVGDLTTLPEEETPTEAVAKGKRGPKGERLTPEQKAASDERRKQQRTNYKENVKAVNAAEAALNDALAPVDAEADDSATTKPKKRAGKAQAIKSLLLSGRVADGEELGAVDKRIAKIQAIKSLLLLNRALKGTKLGDRVAELLKNPAITAQELENVKKGIAAQVSKATTEVKVGRADSRFSKMTTGQQALRHVIKTGNAFQKFLAARLLPFVKDVNFQVLEEDGPLPQEIVDGQVVDDWNESRGMFMREISTGKRFVFVRGVSGGPNQGVNNVTVLHEMLHAALNKKLDMADGAIKAGKDLKSDLVKAFSALQGTMDLTLKRVKEMNDAGTLPEFMGELVVSDIFGDPREFVAYAMSNPRFQKFLMGIEGVTKLPVFTRFVNNVRQFFNMGAMHTSALGDVINITDKMLSSRMTPDMRAALAAERATASTPEISSQLKSEGENEFGDPLRSGKELKKDGEIAAEKVRVSRQGEEGTGIEAMHKARDERKVLSVLQALVKRNWQNTTYPAVQKLVTLPTFTFLAKWSGIKSMNDVDAHLQSMLGMSNSLQAGAQKILVSLKKELNPLFRSAKEFRAKFEDFVYETTLARVDPSDPKAAERIPALDVKWKALGPKGQRMYTMLKQYYEDMVDLYSDLLDQQIQSIQGMSAESKQNLIKTLRATFETGARIRPYFPLVRRGDFWLRVEEKVGKETKQSFYMFETVGERDQRAAEFAAEQGNDVEDLYDRDIFDKGENVGTLRAATQNTSALLTQIFDAIDKEDFGSGDSKDALKDAIYQVYLNTMPEQSFRNQFIHRKDRAGFSTDVLRNVATTASRTSMQLAKLKYSPLLRNSLSAARDAAKLNSNLSPFIEEAQKRINLALTGPQEGIGESIAGVANKISYFWFLSSASTALIQPASIYIAGLPVLGANHNNVAAAAKELGKMVVLMNQYSVLRENADGTTSMVAPSIANNTSLPEHERNAIREMSQRGVTQSTYASEVYGYKDKPTREASTVLGKTKELGKEAADMLVGGLMHNIERLTREAVFLASYRLGVKRGLTPDAAINQAVSDVNEALANYDITNRPRFMQQGIGKIATQFKMFPLHTSLLLCTNFIKMMPLLNKEGKKAAAIKFFGTTMTAASVAGLAGLPFGFLGVIAEAFKHMQDDDEFPDELKDKDPTAWFRNVFLPQQLGEVTIGGIPVSDLLDTGPLNALTGAAIAERIGLNDLVPFTRDTKETKTERDAVTQLLIEAGGPSVSVAISWADAYDAYSVGDYQKMMEKALPSVLRNLVVANKMANEGIKDSKGNVVFSPDEISTGRILAQMIGFRPAVVARMSETNFKLTGVEQSVIFERDRLMLASKVAIRKGTPEGDAQFQKLLETKIDAFNQKHPDYEIDVDSDEFEEAIEKDLESRAEAYLGFKMTEKNAPMASPALEQLEKRIERERAAIKKSKE